MNKLNKCLTNVLIVEQREYSGPAVLLGVLQQGSSLLGSRVVLGVAQPALGVVLHPVAARAVAQQEVLGLLSLQQQAGSCTASP